MSIPLWARKAAIDFIEGAVAAILVLNLVIPATLDEAKAQAAIVGAAILSAAVAAIRRASPDFLAWLREKLGVSA